MCLLQSYFTASEGITHCTAAKLQAVTTLHQFDPAFVYLSCSTTIFGIILFLFKRLYAVCRAKSKTERPRVEATTFVEDGKL